MLRLFTLGGVDLRAGEREVRSVLQQPKRLALLVYLVRAVPPGRFVRRDSLLAMFWPDLDQEHARAALRRSLYFLRQALGDAVIEGRGDEELRVASAQLTCDALDFETALAAGDLARALELYRGDFLPGFFVAGAPEAEQWIDAERDKLRAAAFKAAWSLAEAPGTSAAQSAHWAARAASMQPDDEGALQRQLRVLERAGEATGALRVYDAFARRLAVEDLRPAAATEAAASRLRAAVSGSAAAGRDHREIVVAVMPFEIRAGDALAYLGEGMVDLLAAALDGVDGVRVVDTRVLLGLVGGADGKGPDAAQRLGATHLVRGTLTENAGRLRLSAKLEAVGAGGTPAPRAEVEGSSEQALFDMVDEAVRQLLASRASDPAGGLSRIAARTTTSLAALKSWLTGEHEFRLARYREAAAAFEEATGADASFALAYYRLAASRAALAQIEPALSASSLARRHDERLSQHTATLVEAQRSWLIGRPDDAERRYRAAVAEHPDDVESWYLLGDIHFHANPYRGRSIREARPALERALELDASHLGALAKLARLDALEGRDEDLARRVERYLSISPDADQSLAMRALRAYRLGRPAEKITLIAALRHARPLSVAIAFGDVALYAGATNELETVGRAMLTAVRSDELRAACRVMLAHVMLARGRHEPARAELDVAREENAPWSLGIQGYLAAMPFWEWSGDFVARTTALLQAFDAEAAKPSETEPIDRHNGLHGHIRWYALGLLASRAGDAATVSDAAEQLAELEVPVGAEALVEKMGRTLGALARRLRGDAAGALALLEGARHDVWYQFAVASPIFAGTYDRYLRAELLAEVGRTQEALGWLDAIGERSPWELPFVAPAREKSKHLIADDFEGGDDLTFLGPEAPLTR